MQEPKYRVRFEKEPDVGVRVTWKIELPEGAGIAERVDLLHNSQIVPNLEGRTNFYGVFRLGTRILPPVDLEASVVIENANMDDLLGIRVVTKDREYRWSTNQPKPPFLHASPSKVFSRFDGDVEISIVKLVPAVRAGVITWRVSNE